MIIFCSLFGSCGYRLNSYEETHSIHIPYVKGDQDGTLTAAIIQRFCSSSNAKVESNGRYRLDATIVEETNETIGYRRDPQKIRGKIRKNLVQNEERKTVFVEFSLVDEEKDCVVFGPMRVMANEEYDYIDGDSLPDLQFNNGDGQTFVVLPFSLGQLESLEAAQEASLRPLYQKLSQKIVEIVSSQW